MTAAPDDLLQTVNYSRDRWAMGWVPLALLGCFVGLMFLLYMGPPPPPRALLFALIVFAGVVALGILCMILMDYIGRVAPIIGVLIAVVLLGFAFFTGRPRTRMPDVTFGVLLLTMSTGWITYALYRHFVPAKPWLQLSPSGIASRMMRPGADPLA